MKSHGEGVLSAWTCRVFAVFGVGVLFLSLFLYTCGARINRTHTLPKGLYWAVAETPERGDIVTFRPDDSEPFRMARERGYIIPGRHAGGYDLLLKKLLAVPGDMVSITDAGVIVNGVLIQNTRPLARDNIGDPLPVLRFGNQRLRENEALFLSDHLPRSFDARYFGVAGHAADRHGGRAGMGMVR